MRRERHRAIIAALAGSDPELAMATMDRHLEAVADRALIQSKPQSRRDLRVVLDAYAAGTRAAARRQTKRGQTPRL